MSGNKLVYEPAETTQSVIDVADRLASRMNAEFVIRQDGFCVSYGEANEPR